MKKKGEGRGEFSYCRSKEISKVEEDWRKDLEVHAN